jgi:hypothetical protein
MFRRLRLSSAIAQRTCTTLPSTTSPTGGSAAAGRLENVKASGGTNFTDSHVEGKKAEGHLHQTNSPLRVWSCLQRNKKSKQQQPKSRRPEAALTKSTALVRPFGPSATGLYCLSLTSSIFQWCRLVLHIVWYRLKEVVIARRRRKVERKKNATENKRVKRTGVSDAVDRFLRGIRVDFQTASSSWGKLLSTGAIEWQATLSAMSNDWRNNSTSWQAMIPILSDSWQATCSKISIDWQSALSERSTDWQNKLTTLLYLLLKFAVSFTFAATLTFLKIYSMTPIEDSAWVLMCGVLLPLLIRRRFLVQRSRFLAPRCNSRLGAKVSVKSDPLHLDEDAIEFPDDSGSNAIMTLDSALWMVVVMPTAALLKLHAKHVVEAMLWTSFPVTCMLLLCFLPDRLQKRGSSGTADRKKRKALIPLLSSHSSPLCSPALSSAEKTRTNTANFELS